MNIKAMFILSIAFIFIEYKSNAQNLVPNHSFEDTMNCPWVTGQIDYTKYWYSASAGTPDYFNKCSSGFVGVPNNGAGFQIPKSGNAYSGILLYSSSNYREYIAIKLQDSLKFGNKYCVSFYISLANKFKYATDDIGIYFSKDSIKVPVTTNIPYIPQIENNSGQILSDTLAWKIIEDTLTAKGSETYIIIGNFKHDSITTIVDLGGNGDQEAYYYIDDISVTLCDSGVGIRELTANRSLFTVDPTPVKELSVIRYRLQESNHVSLSLYNMLGHKIADIINESQPAGEQELNFDISEIPAGVYFLKAMVNGLAAQTEKIIIIK